MSYACYNGILQSYKIATQKAVIYITARNRSTFISIFNYIQIQIIFISIPPPEISCIKHERFSLTVTLFCSITASTGAITTHLLPLFFQILHSAYLIKLIIQKISAHCQTYPTSTPLKTCISYTINWKNIYLLLSKIRKALSHSQQYSYTQSTKKPIPLPLNHYNMVFNTKVSVHQLTTNCLLQLY